MDLFVGDLPLFIELTELRDYDIFTYTQGDTENLYLRGQFAPHRNTPSVNALFLRCGPSTGWTRVTLGVRRCERDPIPCPSPESHNIVRISLYLKVPAAGRGADRVARGQEP